MDRLPRLPIGIQAFGIIRREGYLYIDKTKYLMDLIERGKAYFLSRPRRFGKSLTLSTFDAFFSGEKELFRGLYAEEFFGRPGLTTYPVLRLDMSRTVTDRGVEDLLNSMILQVVRNARRHSAELSELALKNPSTALSELLDLVAEKEGKPVVVLIDEYDKPILDHLHDAERAETSRAVLRNFYTQIKAADESVRFVFITGIGKFSKVGVFSAMNNLEDISMDKPYATMLGYTEAELLSSFGGYIDEMGAEWKKGKDEVVSQVRDYYDGFSFDGESRVYNPFSTLNFFKKKVFHNYWFESGTPSFIARYMKDRHLTVEQFRGVEVSRSFATSPGEMEAATAASFLYQSGYLSLRPGAVNDYSLDYPNHEVYFAMSDLLTANIFGSADISGASTSILKEALSRGDSALVVREFNRLLAKIPYDDYAASVREEFEIRNPGANFGEWLYRSTLLSYLYGAGLRVEAELHGHRGRADMVIKFRGRVWVIELKIGRGETAIKKLADEALRQITEMGYANPFKEATLLGMAIDDDRRSITEYRTDAKGSL